MKKETFLQYCFRPTGFGKTSWGVTVYIFATSLLASIAMIASFASWWGLLGMTPVAALILGTYMNYTGRWK